MVEKKYSKYSKKPTISKEEKAEIAKYKEYMKKAIGKNHSDLTPFKLDKSLITLKQLKYGTIRSHRLKSVQIGLDIIELNNSWHEFLLIILHQIIEEHPDNFKDILCKQNITNHKFCINTMYGNYKLDKDKQYTVYKIFDTNYYLEAILDEETIFNTLVHMIKYLDIDLDSLRFDVEAHNIKERKQEVKEKRITSNELARVGIDEAYNYFKDNIHLKEVEFLGETIEVHNIDLVLLTFCNILYDKYGIDKILKLENNEGAGICVNKLSNSLPCARIRDSLAMVYTDSNYENILDFISNSLDILGIKEDNIKFLFKGTSEVKHEWEVD